MAMMVMSHDDGVIHSKFSSQKNRASNIVIFSMDNSIPNYTYLKVDARSNHKVRML